MAKPKIRFKGYTDDWEQRKFGDLGSVAMCKRIFKEQTSTDGDIPFYKIGTFGAEPDAFISRELFEEYRGKFQYPNIGDMLISASGTIGRTVEYKGEEAYFQDSNIVWFKHDDRVDNSFLKCIYEIVKWSGIEGSTIKRLYNDNFLKTEFSMPKVAEQQQIGMYFQSLDHLITLHQRKCEETKKLKKYMLQKMFPQNGQTVPEIRFSGFTDAWEQRKFGDLVEKYEDPIDTPTDGYMRLGIRSHAKGTFHSYVEKGKELETAKMFRVAANNFIVNITFGWEHAVAITDESDAGKLVSHRFPQYSFENGMIPMFFKYLILDENFKHHLELSSPGGAGRNRVLKLNDMLEYKMKFPCEDEQRKLASYFDDLDHLITLHQYKCEQLQSMKKFMLQNMFV